MGLFRKREEKKPENTVAPAVANTGSEAGPARVKVLGSGCAKCNQLEAATKAALLQLGMAPVVEHVTDFTVIAGYGVMSTPALVLDDKVLSYGKVLKSEEIVKLIRAAQKT